MKTAELRELSAEELNNRIDTLKRENYNLNFKSVVEQVEDNSIFRKNRREIACVKTILNERIIPEKDEKDKQE